MSQGNPQGDASGQVEHTVLTVLRGAERWLTQRGVDAPKRSEGTARTAADGRSPSVAAATARTSASTAAIAASSVTSRCEEVDIGRKAMSALLPSGDPKVNVRRRNVTPI